MSEPRAPGHTYGEALNIDPLLRLQQPFSPENPHHDELQYVVIHQCSELWFKLMLHELDAVSARTRQGDVREAARLLRRVTQIVGLIDQGFHLMESMTARDYAAFRDNLFGGSGFQSAQFREVEIALGCHRPATLNQPAFTPEERERIAWRLAQPNLWDSFVAAMRQAGYAVPDRAEAEADPGAAAQVLTALKAMYTDGAHPDLQALSEEMSALENAMALWRTHHALMAERAIGSKQGTGGEGVEYLYRSARVRCFPELTAIRGLL
jgi:tryptophan 2,3-dioxygenase